MCTAGAHVSYFQQPTLVQLRLHIQCVLLNRRASEIRRDGINRCVGSRRIGGKHRKGLWSRKWLRERCLKRSARVRYAGIQPKSGKWSTQQVLIEGLAGGSRVIRTKSTSEHHSSRAG